VSAARPGRQPLPTSRTGGGTRPERRLEAALRAAGAPEWEREPEDFGRADFVWRHVKPSPIAVYVDGCCWHACPLHGRTTRAAGHGLSAERTRMQAMKDRVRRDAMRAAGVNVIALWEHEVDLDPGRCARKVLEALRR
jgi:DNA mismatch endonuclease, patch repair protein